MNVEAWNEKAYETIRSTLSGAGTRSCTAYSLGGASKVVPLFRSSHLLGHLPLRSSYLGTR